MGYQLSEYAETVAGLTGQQRVVFAAMCKVTDDRHGFFWMDADRFRTEHPPHIRSNSTLRNHISAIIDAGYIRKVHQGAGPRNGPGRRRRGRAGFTQYFIDAPGITPDLPRQYRMPLLRSDDTGRRASISIRRLGQVSKRRRTGIRKTRFLSGNRTSLVIQSDRNRIIRDLSENRTDLVKTCPKTRQVS